MLIKRKIILYSILILLVSCDSSGPKEKDFLGTWRVHAKNKETGKWSNAIHRFTFRKNGVFNTRIEFWKPVRGNWILDNDKLRIDLDSTSIVGTIINLDTANVHLETTVQEKDSSIKVFDVNLEKEPFVLEAENNWN